MKVGDLIEWAGFMGVVTEFVEHQEGYGWLMRVHWVDDGESLMYENEIKRVEYGY